MSRERGQGREREREFSRRELLRAGWSIPLVVAMGGVAAACGGGDSHDDLSKEILDLNRKNQRQDRGARSTPTTSTSTATSTTSTTSTGSTTPSSPPGTTPRRSGGGVHTDVPHVDSAHGDVAAASVLHVDEHGDAPETTHDDILAFERGEGPRFVTVPHVDTPHADDVPHIDAPTPTSPTGTPDRPLVGTGPQ